MPYLIGAERRAVATGKHLPCLKLPSKFDLVTIRKRFRSTFFLSSSRSPFVNFLLLANDDPLVTLVETVGHSLNETVIFFPYSIERNLSRFDREKKKKKISLHLSSLLFTNWQFYARRARTSCLNSSLRVIETSFLDNSFPLIVPSSSPSSPSRIFNQNFDENLVRPLLCLSKLLIET